MGISNSARSLLNNLGGAHTSSGASVQFGSRQAAFSHAGEEGDSARLVRDLFDLQSSLSLENDQKTKRPLTTQARQVIKSALTAGRNGFSEPLLLAAEILLRTSDNVSKDLKDISDIIAVKTEKKDFSLAVAAKFLKVIGGAHFHPIGLIDSLRDSFNGKQNFSTADREELLNSLSGLPADVGPLRQAIVLDSWQRLYDLRYSRKIPVTSQEELYFFKIASQNIDIGSGIILNRLIKSPEEELGSFRDCSFDTRVGILKCFAEFGLGDCGAFKRLFHIELEELPNRSVHQIFKLYHLAANCRFLTPVEYPAFMEALRAKAQDSTLQAELHDYDAHSIIEHYHVLLNQGLWSSDLQVAFEAVIIKHLSSTGRSSATTLDTAAKLAEIAARAPQVLEDFRLLVARRADEHLRGALDEGGSAVIPLMFYLASISEDSLHHIRRTVTRFPEKLDSRLVGHEALMLGILTYLSDHLSHDRFKVFSGAQHHIEDESVRNMTQTLKLIIEECRGHVSITPDELGFVDLLFDGIHRVFILRAGQELSQSEMASVEEVGRRVLRLAVPHIQTDVISIPTELAEVERGRKLRECVLGILYAPDMINPGGEPRLVDFD